MKIVSVVLSGGAGTRLWPVSRQARPKPFMQLGGKSLLEQAVTRGQATGADEVLVVTNQDHLFMTQNVIGEMADPPATRYLLEPNGRNTAPAIVLAALEISEVHGPDTVMLVLPADHLIPDTSAFVANALEASRCASDGKLVVFGIQPTAPEVGFGYLEVAKPGNQTQPVLNFVEKPDLSLAISYLETGRYYWNSGMFCFTAETLIRAMEACAPNVLAAAKAVNSTANHKAGHGCTQRITTFDPHLFGLQPDISLDYAVMERAKNVVLVPAKFGWSDVGAWPAVADAHVRDSNGNTMSASEHIDWIALATRNTHIHIESQGQKRVVATLGIENAIVVHTPDALLIADKAHSQDVRAVVDALKQRHISSDQHQSTIMPHRVERPWGTYTTIQEGSGYKVKCIAVRPGQSLSLQYHNRRSEHWIVVRGRGTVQIGEKEYPATYGSYYHIQVAETHRLTNTGEEELALIEVQIGNYLGEDDIVRLQDSYGRI